MSRQTPIHTILYFTIEAYHEYRFELFMRWCLQQCNDAEQDVKDPAFSKPDLQHLLANQKISAWYNHQINLHEEQFLESIRPQHGNINYKIARNIYVSYVSQIHSVYPQPLLEAARKLNIIEN